MKLYNQYETLEVTSMATSIVTDFTDAIQSVNKGVSNEKVRTILLKNKQYY